MTADRRILEGDSVLPAMDAPLPLKDHSKAGRGDGHGGSPPRASKPGRPGGRWAVLNAFVDVTIRDLDGSTVKVWFILFRDTKQDGLARASDADLGRRAGVSVRTIYTARKRLERAGLLRVVRKGRLGAGGSIYRVLALPQLEAGCRLQPATARQNPQKPVARIPEGDQKGRPDPGGSDAERRG
jgi:hypothetical protein